jgi:hypothetical protein
MSGKSGSFVPSEDRSSNVGGLAVAFDTHWTFDSSIEQWQIMGKMLPEVSKASG